MVIKIVRVRFLHDKYKDQYLKVKQVFLKKHSDICIKPQNRNDFEKDRVYYCILCKCKKQCISPNTLCQLKKAFVICMGGK